MKIGINKYFCAFCDTINIQKVNKISSNGRRCSAVDNVVCKCGRLISQKTSDELNYK